MKKYLLFAAMTAMSAMASANTVTFTTCNGADWKITSVLDLTKNTLKQKTPQRTGRPIKTLKPIEILSTEDIGYLNFEGAIPATDIQSGYKAVIDGSDGSKTTDVYFLNLKNGGQALAYGAMVIAGPCAK